MEYLTEINSLCNELKNIIGVSLIDGQIKEINILISNLKDKRIPLHQLPKIGLQPDDLSELLLKFPSANYQLTKINNLLNNLRSYLAQKFGLWSIANQTTAGLIAQKFELSVGLEVMAGNAMWSKSFSNCHCKMIVTDDLTWSKSSSTGQKQFMNVNQMSAIEALSQYHNQVDFIIISWAPNFGKADWQFLQEYRKLANKPLLLVVGEVSGATNSNKFWRRANISTLGLDIKRSFSSFDFIDEKIMRVE